MRCFRVAASLYVFLILSGIAFADVTVRAYLYNPEKDSVVLTYPYAHENNRIELYPQLVITGTGISDGEFQLNYSIESGGTKLYSGSFTVKAINGFFAQEVKLDKLYPSAERVSWELKEQNTAPISSVATLKWSRFHGKVKFLNPQDKSDAYIDLIPINFHAPGEIFIPLDKDGHFDIMVPARIYRVMNVNSMGYSYNAMERWAWDYDLTRDREDEFVIGRIELYSIRVFEVVGGPRTLFVAFRPTSLSRVLKFDKNGNGLVEGSERDATREALKHSFTAIGPELTAENIKVWIDGKLHPVIHLTQIPEYDGNGINQVQYLLQVDPMDGRLYGASHEIKIEVESEEELNGKKIRDWGQGSVGYYPWGYYQDLF